MRLMYATIVCGVILCACSDEPTRPVGNSVDGPSFGKTPALPANPELAYGANSGSVQYLWVANADGSNATALVQLPDFWKPFPSWAPGGDGTAAAPYRLAFSNGGCHMERVDVTIDPATGRPVASNRIDLDAKFDTPSESCNPAWSPAGDRIAFVNLAPEPDGTYSLWVVDPLAATPPVCIYTAPPGYYVSEPTWSPDASEIALLERYRVGSGPYPAAIKVVTVATRTARTVLEAGALPGLRAPDWARTSDALLFSAETGGSSLNEVWRLDLQTLQRAKVTSGVGATWSPTDDRFAYVSGPGKLSIYSFATRTTTSLGMAATWPDWRRR